MKKRSVFWSSLILGLSLIVCGPAGAQDFSSFYITPKIMTSYQKADIPGQGSDRSAVFGLGLSVGTDLSYSTSWPVRLEAEYLYHGNQSFTHSRFRTENEISAHSLLANAFYDISTDTVFTPYVGGGFGVAWVNNHVTGANVSVEVSRWNFAWNLGGGVAWSLNENLALDLGYRYMDLGKSDTVLVPGGNTPYHISLTAHEFGLGLRITGF